MTTEGGERVFKTETANAYGPPDSDQRLGQLSEAKVTHTRRKSGEGEADAPRAVRKSVRKSAFAYHVQVGCVGKTAHAGLLCRAVAEPHREAQGHHCPRLRRVRQPGALQGRILRLRERLRTDAEL